MKMAVLGIVKAERILETMAIVVAGQLWVAKMRMELQNGKKLYAHICFPTVFDISLPRIDRLRYLFELKS